MKIIKRSGMEDTFDIKKIEAAIRKANESVIDYEKLTELTRRAAELDELLLLLMEKWETLSQASSV